MMKLGLCQDVGTAALNDQVVFVLYNLCVFRDGNAC